MPPLTFQVLTVPLGVMTEFHHGLPIPVLTESAMDATESDPWRYGMAECRPRGRTGVFSDHALSVLFYKRGPENKAFKRFKAFNGSKDSNRSKIFRRSFEVHRPPVSAVPADRPA